MAKPRVFVSSTFYDLKQVREDLKRFISGLGYDPVLHETGEVAYGKESPLERYLHREIQTCDILTCVIGGRYGTDSQERPDSSITRQELTTAIENQVQVFIFIEQDVHAEYNTYLLNKDTANIKYRYVDDVRVFEFIESVYNLPGNNPISPFDTVTDIVEFLRSQWAGLFQRFLQDQRRFEEIRILREMKSMAGTLEQLVSVLTKEGKSRDSDIEQILLTYHPMFHRLQVLTKTEYRVFFTDEEELGQWLQTLRWKPVPEEAYDHDSYREWINKETSQYLKLTEAVFDDEHKLKAYSEDTWIDNWLQLLDLDEDDEAI